MSKRILSLVVTAHLLHEQASRYCTENVTEHTCLSKADTVFRELTFCRPRNKHFIPKKSSFHNRDGTAVENCASSKIFEANDGCARNKNDIGG